MEFHLVPVCVLEIRFKTICPPGIAENAFDLRNRGHSEYGEITCWPKQHTGSFFTGGSNPYKEEIRTRYGVRLWDQELRVYYRERKKHIIKIVETLDKKAKPIPRKGEYTGKKDKRNKRKWNPGITYDIRPYPEDFGEEPMEEIFVFGSNLAGIHGAGAAAYAAKHHGAIMGQGIGLQGSSYALPTKSKTIRKLSLAQVEKRVAAFLEYAKHRPNFRFKVTQIGCGLAGFTGDEIAPLFRDAPENCSFDTAWKQYLGEEKHYWGTF